MGESELKTALRHEGEVRAREFWQQSEAAVEKRRKEIEAELDRLRAEAGRSRQAEETVLRNKLLSEARARATGCRLHAEAAMESHLLEIAGRVLIEMARTSRREVWQALSRELPDYEWTNLTVHPEDLEVARQTFPSAAIACAEAIGGGLVANDAEGTVRIDNSLSRRLLRAWPDLLPNLMKDLRERVDRDAASRNDTTI
jgi:V/A-type H+-transporting ATPase subunit E